MVLAVEGVQLLVSVLAVVVVVVGSEVVGIMECGGFAGNRPGFNDLPIPFRISTFIFPVPPFAPNSV